MTCVDDWKVGLIGASLFVGWCSTLLWVPALADRNGRKKYFWLSVAADMVLYTVLMFTKNLIMMIAIWFLFGCLTTIRMQVGYIYMMELLPKKAQTPVTSGWNVQSAVLYITMSLYYLKISKHWFWITLVGWAWNLISVILLFWMPESP